MEVDGPIQERALVQETDVDEDAQQLDLPQRSLGPDFGLPAEVFLYILQLSSTMTCVRKRRFLTGMSLFVQVCKYWRDFIYESPTLWTWYEFRAFTISEEEDELLDFTIALPEEVKALTRLAIARSKTAHLSVVICPKTYFQGDDGMATFACSYSSRWETLWMEMINNIPLVLSTTLSSELPKLRRYIHYVQTAPPGNEHVSLLSQAPNLISYASYEHLRSISAPGKKTPLCRIGIDSRSAVRFIKSPNSRNPATLGNRHRQRRKSHVGSRGTNHSTRMQVNSSMERGGASVGLTGTDSRYIAYSPVSQARRPLDPHSIPNSTVNVNRIYPSFWLSDHPVTGWI